MTVSTTKNLQTYTTTVFSIWATHYTTKSRLSSTPTNLSSRVRCSSFSIRRVYTWFGLGLVCAHRADFRKIGKSGDDPLNLIPRDSSPLLPASPTVNTTRTLVRYRPLNHYQRAQQGRSDGGRPPGATWRQQSTNSILLFWRWWRVGRVLGRLSNRFRCPDLASTSVTLLQNWNSSTPHTFITLLNSSREPSCVINAKTVYLRILIFIERLRRWGRVLTSSLYVCKLYVIYFCNTYYTYLNQCQSI